MSKCNKGDYTWLIHYHKETDVEKVSTVRLGESSHWKDHVNTMIGEINSTLDTEDSQAYIELAKIEGRYKQWTYRRRNHYHAWQLVNSTPNSVTLDLNKIDEIFPDEYWGGN